MNIIIAAIAENRTLGKDNRIIWHLPNDFKRFKKLTTGNPIIMGRKTFESLPNLLPNRLHIVITRQDEYKPEGCIVVKSIEEAFEVTKKYDTKYIIGGGEIYTLALPFVQKIELTKIHHPFDGDTFFPELNEKEWKIIQSELNKKDDKHLYDYTYETFVRI